MYYCISVLVTMSAPESTKCGMLRGSTEDATQLEPQQPIKSHAKPPLVPPPMQFPPVPKIIGHMNPKKNPKCRRQKNNLKYNDGRRLRLKTIRDAFSNLAQLRKSDRNRSILHPYQIYIIKRARHERHTPKELESMTGLSVYRIHQVVNMNTPPSSPSRDEDSVKVTPVNSAIGVSLVESVAGDNTNANLNTPQETSPYGDYDDYDVADDSDVAVDSDGEWSDDDELITP